MSQNSSISLKNVNEYFQVDLNHEGKLVRERVWALRDINLNVNAGESVALIGPNGAGKTTMLRLIAGLLKPDEGQIIVRGRVGTLLDLGAGFHPELTGRDNVFLNASLYNFDKTDIESRFREIVKFAEIGKFIDAPLKTYSQGMYVRLAFSLAIHVNPDILLVDDCLAVGDEDFQAKCLERVMSLKQDGVCIIFVTHDMELAKIACDKGILIDHGQIIQDGYIETVVNEYSNRARDRKASISQSQTIENGPMKLILGSNSVSIFFNDSKLTSGAGMYSQVCVDGIRHDTKGRLHKLIKKNSKSMQIRIYLNEISLTCIWDIELELDKVSWRTEFYCSGASRVQSYKNEILIEKGYDAWVNDKGYGNFDDGSTARKTAAESSELVISALRSAGGLPDIILKPEDGYSSALPASGVGNGARILSIASKDDILPFKACIVSLKISTQRAYLDEIIGDIENTICKNELEFMMEKTKKLSEQINILIDSKLEQIKSLMHNMKNAFEKMRIANGNLEVVYNLNTLEILFKNKKLTNLGIVSIFQVDGAQHDSRQSAWSMKKISDNDAVFLLKWESLDALFQVWKVRVENEHEISLEILMSTLNGKKIINTSVKLDLARENSDVILDSKLDLIASPGLPNIGFGTFSEDKIASIYSHNQRSTSLYFLTANGYNQENSKSKIFTFFKGNIVASVDKIDNVESARAKASISLELLKLSFDEGQCRLYHGQIELTKGLGIYSSVYDQRDWHDSTQAKWKVNYCDGARMELVGFWTRIPISQKWVFQFLNNTDLLLDIQMDINGNSAIDIDEVVIMASDKYHQWVAQQKPMAFPEYFTKDDFFRCCVYSAPAMVGSVGLSSGSMPELSIKALDAKDIDFAIENSSHIFGTKCRLLHCIRFSKGMPKASKGSHSLFKGIITIKGGNNDALSKDS